MEEKQEVINLAEAVAQSGDGYDVNILTPEHPEVRSARLVEEAKKASFNRFLVSVLLVTVVGFAIAAFFLLSSNEPKTVDLARSIISGVITALLGFLAGLGAGKIS